MLSLRRVYVCCEINCLCFDGYTSMKEWKTSVHPGSSFSHCQLGRSCGRAVAPKLRSPLSFSVTEHAVKVCADVNPLRSYLDEFTHNGCHGSGEPKHLRATQVSKCCMSTFPKNNNFWQSNYHSGKLQEHTQIWISWGQLVYIVITTTSYLQPHTAQQKDNENIVNFNSNN